MHLCQDYLNCFYTLWFSHGMASAALIHNLVMNKAICRNYVTDLRSYLLPISSFSACFKTSGFNYTTNCINWYWYFGANPMSLQISMNFWSYLNGLVGLSEETEKFSVCNFCHVPFLLLPVFSNFWLIFSRSIYEKIIEKLG